VVEVTALRVDPPLAIRSTIREGRRSDPQASCAGAREVPED